MIRKFWNDCTGRIGLDAEYAGTICFGENADEANNAIQDIVRGEKKGYIYPENGYRSAMKGVAKLGQINIVVDWQDMPHAAIETIAVRRVKLAELTNEICALDGSGMDLEKWQMQRLPAIKTEIEELGNALDDETSLVVEEFRMVYTA